MACLMDGGVESLSVTHLEGFSLDAHHYAVSGVFEITYFSELPINQNYSGQGYRNNTSIIAY
jgi:hypothetical protein